MINQQMVGIGNQQGGVGYTLRSANKLHRGNTSRE
jgi:hypothetical protein